MKLGGKIGGKELEEFPSRNSAEKLGRKLNSRGHRCGKYSRKTFAWLVNRRLEINFNFPRGGERKEGKPRSKWATNEEEKQVSRSSGKHSSRFPARFSLLLRLRHTRELRACAVDGRVATGVTNRVARNWRIGRLENGNKYRPAG